MELSSILRPVNKLLMMDRGTVRNM